jgi:hypothetical protein
VRERQNWNKVITSPTVTDAMQPFKTIVLIGLLHPYSKSDQFFFVRGLWILRIKAMEEKKNIIKTGNHSSTSNLIIL